MANKRRANTSDTARDEAIEAAMGALKRAMGATFGRRRQALTARGISLPQFFVIKMLASGHVSTPRELAGALGVTAGNITGLIAKLERSGFVTRAADPKDRRVVRLKLTVKAEKGLAALQKAADAEAAKAFEAWSTEDIVKLRRMLERLAPDDPRCGPGRWGWGPPWAQKAGLTEGRLRRRARL